MRKRRENTVTRLGWSTREVAEMLGCSKRHIINQIKAGELPSVKLGNRRLVLAADLDEYFARQRASSARPRLVG
jgi:excisionase family DNA binding protein